MAKYQHSPTRGWIEKFADAFRGIKVGLRGQISFCVHLFFTAVVILAGMVLKMELLEWCLLALCITTVLAAEMFNTALESMARAISDEVRPELGNALDIGSAGVLLSALGAVVVGSTIFLHRLAVLLLGWQCRRSGVGAVRQHRFSHPVRRGARDFRLERQVDDPPQGVGGRAGLKLWPIGRCRHHAHALPLRGVEAGLAQDIDGKAWIDSENWKHPMGVNATFDARTLHTLRQTPGQQFTPLSALREALGTISPQPPFEHGQQRRGGSLTNAP
jgi:diacylglycerol kinase